MARALIALGQPDRATVYLREVLQSPISNPIEEYRAKMLLEELGSTVQPP